MKNTLIIDGFQAVISFDPEIEMFRGEFVNLNGGADFYAADVLGLHREGEISLRIFLEECVKAGVEPRKNYSGKFMLRVDPSLHEAVAIAAAADGKSLNQWAEEVLRATAVRNSGKLPDANDHSYAIAA